MDYTLDELLNGELDNDADAEAMNPTSFKEYEAFEAGRLFNAHLAAATDMNNRVADGIKKLNARLDTMQELMESGHQIKEIHKKWKKFNQ